MWWALFALVANFALQIAFMPKPQNAKPSALEDFTVPTADEGREIVWLFGTHDLTGPNVVWWGDFKKSAIKGKREYGLFGPRQTLGWKYSLGMHLALCYGPADYLLEIRVADKTAWQGAASGGQISIDETKLFGGDQSEGGIKGDIDVEMGAPSQGQNDYLQAQLSSNVPAFRGVMCLVLRQVYLGTTTYLKAWAPRVQRIYLRNDGSDQWYPDKAGIPQAGFRLTWWQIGTAAGDSARMGVTFFDDTSTQLGDILWADYDGENEWIKRALSVAVPSGAVTVRIYMEFQKVSGPTAGSKIDDIDVENGGGALLAVNTGAEDGDLTGWTVDEGDLTISTAAHSGTYSFHGGSSTYNRAYQDISLGTQTAYSKVALADTVNGGVFSYADDIGDGYVVKGSDGTNQIKVTKVATNTDYTISTISTPQAVHICANGDLLAWNNYGNNIYVYDLADGSLKQTITGLAGGGGTEYPSAEITISGVTYVVLWKGYVAHLLSCSGSTWSIEWATDPGSILNAHVIALGPDYIYALSEGGETIGRFAWSTAALGTYSTHAVTGATQTIWAIHYDVNSGDVITIGNHGELFILSADLASVVRSTTGPDWGTIDINADGQLTSNRMMLEPTSFAFLAPGSHTIYEYSVTDLSLLNTYDTSNWGFSSFEFAGIDPANRTVLLVDRVSGTRGLLYLDPQGAQQILDMNPAHIVRECFTDLVAGMGYNSSDIDDTAFTLAADTLYSEGFGLSGKWQHEEEIDEFVKIVLQHVDGVRYVDRRTGKFVMKLIRKISDTSGLTELTDDDVIEWSDLTTRQMTPDTINHVIVKYYDRDRRAQGSVTVTNDALVQQMGRVVSTTREYPLICYEDLAIRVATRDVIALSPGLRSGRIVCKRTAQGLNPGDAFKLTSTRHGLSSVVMRVSGDVKFGDGRKNAVTISFIEDVFALADQVSVTVTTGSWSDPSNAPMPVTIRLVEEMPYQQLVAMAGSSSTADLLSGDPDAGLLQYAGAAPTSDATSAVVDEDAGSGYSEVDQLDFGPGALLSADLAIDATTASYGSDSDVDLVDTGTLATIGGSEIVKVTAIDTTAQTLTIARGCLDTVPLAHATGAAIVFFDGHADSDFEARTAADTVGVKLETITSQGALAQASAPSDTVIFASRGARPLPPANVQVNSVGYGDVDCSALASIPVSWARRNRLSNTTTVAGWTDADQAPETGQTTTVELTDLSGTVLYSYTGITGTSQSVDPANFGAATEGYIKVKSVRDGYDSWTSYSLHVLISNVRYLEDGSTERLEEDGATARTLE